MVCKSTSVITTIAWVLNIWYFYCIWILPKFIYTIGCICHIFSLKEKATRCKSAEHVLKVCVAQVACSGAATMLAFLNCYILPFVIISNTAMLNCHSVFRRHNLHVEWACEKDIRGFLNLSLHMWATKSNVERLRLSSTPSTSSNFHGVTLFAHIWSDP